MRLASAALRIAALGAAAVCLSGCLVGAVAGATVGAAGAVAGTAAGVAGKAVGETVHVGHVAVDAATGSGGDKPQDPGR